jgi:hypothetical protein
VPDARAAGHVGDGKGGVHGSLLFCPC